MRRFSCIRVNWQSGKKWSDENVVKLFHDEKNHSVNSWDNFVMLANFEGPDSSSFDDVWGTLFQKSIICFTSLT